MIVYCTWNAHINQITATANRSLGFIMRNLSKCPQNIKVNAYKSLVWPLIEYSSSVWDPHTAKKLIPYNEGLPDFV